MIAAAMCGTIPMVQPNAATTLAREPRDSPAASVNSTPVPGEATTMNEVMRNSRLTGVLRLFVADRMSRFGAADKLSPDPPQHLLHMGDRRRRQDAVAEIEDQRAIAEIFQNAVDRAIERRAAGKQNQRVEIALHGNAALHPL